VEGKLDALPSVAAFEAATLENPLDWRPRVTRAHGQSDESYDEQQRTLMYCCDQVDKFLNPISTRVHFPMIHGRAGSGKTFLLQTVMLYAVSKGLRISLISVTSERARTMGGNHLHLQFPLTVEPVYQSHSRLKTEKCVKALHRDPFKLHLIKRTQVFFLEEAGFLNAETFEIVDSVMRFICESNLPFGGRLLIGNGDSRQIQPVEGMPFWNSYMFGSSFKVCKLDHFVRSSEDTVLQECIKTFDVAEVTDAEAEVFAGQIIRLSNFCSSWNEVPEGCFKVVSTRKGEEEVMSFYDVDPSSIIEMYAVDEVDNGTEMWTETDTESIKRKLDKFVLEPRVLRLFPGAFVQMTFNKKEGDVQFSPGQLGKVIDVFKEEELAVVGLLPPGRRSFEDVENHELELVTVGYHYSNPIVNG
jgi:hypothetical protein